MPVDRINAGSLHGSHFETCKNGIIEAPRSGATPIAPIEPKMAEFTSEIKPAATVLPQLLLLLPLLPVISSAAKVVNDAVLGLGWKLGFDRRNSG